MDLYTLRAWEQMSYLSPPSSQDHVREVWNLILKPIFHLATSGGKSFMVKHDDNQDGFPQISVANLNGRFGTSPLFKVYCVGFADPDTNLWKALEDAVQLDLLEASSMLDGKPRASLFAAIAVGPLDFDVIVEHLLQIREAME